ncbi:MAG: TfuA domain-containing protein, partial [Myxococcales bacterium]|nr:TfuA domain-containing protein [Myxococcales bacterium]
MGDVYRLVASGVRIIVLIDGIFHGAAAIWHRELLEAMDHGICVIGASSMGALRAAELHALGMIGVGTIFEWYRDGLIDGDDEVALLHSEADDGYRLLSQPLVNTRHRLLAAVERGGLTPEQAHAAIAHVKKSPFMWRTHGELLASEVVGRWPEDARRCLKDVLDDADLDLKARDAERALEHASARLARGEVRPPIVDRPTPSRYYRATSKRKRGLRHPKGHFVSGEEVWGWISSDRALVRQYLAKAATRFYLGSLAEHWELQCPDEHVQAFGERWNERHGIGELEPWLVANG